MSIISDLKNKDAQAVVSRLRESAASASAWKFASASLLVAGMITGAFTLPILPSSDPDHQPDALGIETITLAERVLESRSDLAASRSLVARDEHVAPEPVDPESLLAVTNISAEGINLIKEFEGFSDTGYLLGDGMCTIGWGHAIPVAERPDCLEWVITEEEAHQKLADNIQFFEAAVNDFFTREFNQNQFDALVSFSYNVGEPWFRYDWPTDPDDEFFERVLPLYVYPAQFTEGLARRRAAEVELFNTPIPGLEHQVEEAPAE